MRYIYYKRMVTSRLHFAHQKLPASYLARLQLESRPQNLSLCSLVREPRRYKIDLVEHMAECDQNYARIVKLFPDHAEVDHRNLLLCFGEEVVNVRLSVLERSRYTSVILLTQETSSVAPSNSIRIRVYHDAKSAEVIEIQNQRRFEAIYGYPNPKMRQRDEKKQINRFLGEFLGFCLTFGASSDVPYENVLTIR
ncbi:uncharacterized protein METZ01_LOCUS20851 [marine metagenome]|uniref:DUF1249 domain-containing protein n=1 Tax=marine metagenome TaxID=408172 RepID=A0A381PPG9_9ZZZZ